VPRRLGLPSERLGSFFWHHGDSKEDHEGEGEIFRQARSHCGSSGAEAGREDLSPEGRALEGEGSSEGPGPPVRW